MTTDAPSLPPPIERDADTVELMTAFLEESSEGLAEADALLVAATRGPVAPEGVHALFRVFHTIKGVAGFLDLRQAVALAHATEALLDHARAGRLALAGEALDLVFDATAVMRALLDAVRVALTQRREVAHVEAVEPLVARLGAASARAANHTSAKAQPPQPDAGARADTRDAMSTGDAAARETAPAETAAPGAEAPATTAPGASSNEAPTAPGAAAVRATLKVDVERVDSVVDLIGELIIAQSMVVSAPELQALASPRLKDALGQLAKISRDLQDVAMRMRMVPVRGVFQKMARLCRDLAHKTGKRVTLVTRGDDTEVDRSMAERLEEPLVHMVRNAIDHGVELPEVRARAGKPEVAQLVLSAAHEGGQVVVELRDDGRGIDRAAVLKRARERGLLGPGETPEDRDIDALIFAPGFSTAAVVTELSGRGVGMDVVKRNVEALRGRVTVDSTPGQGTAFRMVLPLTLAIIDGLLVSCGGERFVVPSLCILELLQPKAAMLETLGGRDEYLVLRGEPLPLVRLHRLFSLPGAITEPTRAIAIVVESLGRKAALLADEALAQQQVVIKPLNPALGADGHFSGAAILADGRAGLILHVDRIVAQRIQPRARVRREHRPEVHP